MIGHAAPHTNKNDGIYILHIYCVVLQKNCKSMKSRLPVCAPFPPFPLQQQQAAFAAFALHICTQALAGEFEGKHNFILFSKNIELGFQNLKDTYLFVELVSRPPPII